MQLESLAAYYDYCEENVWLDDNDMSICDYTQIYDDTCTRYPSFGKPMRACDYVMIFYRIENYTSLLGLFFNVFHLMVLSRKTMRASSTNVIMIGIAICDIASMAYNMKLWRKLYKEENDTDLIETCEMVDTWFEKNLYKAFYQVQEAGRWCSPIFGVLMALVRYLTIRFLSVSDKFSQAKTGVISVISVFIFALIFAVLTWFRYEYVAYDEPWYPWVGCYDWGYPDGVGYPVYHEVATGFLPNLYVYIGIIFKLPPTILLPILTALLISELVKAKRNRMRLSNSSAQRSGGDRTTFLVLMMTILYVIAEIPNAFVNILEGLFPGDSGLISLLNYFQYFASLVVNLTGVIHLLVCLAMSSQYRDAAKKMLGILNFHPDRIFETSQTSQSSSVSRRSNRTM
uniref:G_PROTEIN_RECEP_F1_2 domain-containing protein n=1 Tax=Caenorhabditis japonica TaxID=281687 RepID=A0A8R1HGM0_CAEJA